MLAGTKTLAIILGASDWPHYPSLEPSPIFRQSAEYFREYLTSSRGLRLPPLNVKYLFDNDLQPGPLMAEIRSFIRDRSSQSSEITDLIFYYVGHGGYLRETEYFLALRATTRQAKEATIFKISYLRDIIIDVALDKRSLIILDACYSGGALAEFAHMSDGEEDATHLIEAAISDESVTRGAVLFCAAGAKKWAKAPVEGKFTMFSGSLLQVLEKGDQEGDRHLSLKDFARLVQKQIYKEYGQEAVKPQIHVPMQDLRDILEDPYFPNQAYPASDVDRIVALEEEVAALARKVDGFSNRSLQRVSGGVDAVVVDASGDWRADVLGPLRSQPERCRALAVAALKQVYGPHTNADDNIIDYVIDNFLEKICYGNHLFGIQQVANVVLRPSKIAGHLQWEERKDYILCCPLSNGEDTIYVDTAFLATEEKINEALGQANFRVKLDNRRTLFDFATWWKQHGGKAVKSGYTFEDDEIYLAYDGMTFVLRCEKRIAIERDATKVSIYELSFLSEEDRCYSLTMMRPTRGLHFTMSLEGLDNWVLKDPTIGAMHYHPGAKGNANIDRNSQRSVTADVPGWILPGLALLIEWAPVRERG